MVGLLNGVDSDSPATVTGVEASVLGVGGGYQRPLIERVAVAGREFYVCSRGYGEGYLYSLHASLEDARAEFAGIEMVAIEGEESRHGQDR